MNKSLKRFKLIIIFVLVIVNITGCFSEQKKYIKQTSMLESTIEPIKTIVTSASITTTNINSSTKSSSSKQTFKSDNDDPIIETNENIIRSDMNNFFEFVYYRLYKSGKLELKVIHVDSSDVGRDQIFPLDKSYRKVENLGAVKKVYVGSLIGYYDSTIEVVLIMKDGTVEQLKDIYDKSLKTNGKVKGLENCVDFKEKEGHLSVIQNDGKSIEYVTGMSN